jgi:hypothetical protein
MKIEQDYRTEWRIVLNLANIEDIMVFSFFQKHWIAPHILQHRMSKII